MDGPTMAADTVVQDAARAAIDSPSPIRVVHDGQVIGIVDEEAIMRVVVAEEDTRAGGESA
jgi:glycine betaine/proline transport system ATP-binding protein